MLLDRATGAVARPDGRLRLLGGRLSLGAGLEGDPLRVRRCAGRETLYRVALAGGAPAPLWTGGSIAGLARRGRARLLRHEHAVARRGALERGPRRQGAGGRSRTSTTRCSATSTLGEVSERFTDSSDRPQAPGVGGQAAGLRSGEEVSGGLPHPRRPAGRVGGRLVVPLEPAGLGGLRLRRLRGESARLDRVRPGLSRRDQRRLGRPGLRRPDAPGRRPRVAAVRRQDAHRRRGRLLRRLHGQLDRRAHAALRGARLARRHLRPRVGQPRDRGALVSATGSSRAGPGTRTSTASGARWSRPATSRRRCS